MKRKTLIIVASLGALVAIACIGPVADHLVLSEAEATCLAVRGHVDTWSSGEWTDPSDDVSWCESRY